MPGTGVPLMAAGGTAGVITLWNLEEKRLQTIIRDAHDAPLLSLHFFAGEPRLMSSAADNSVKQWLFDAPDGSGRLLRFRSGHSKPPAVVRYYGDGTRLLTAGRPRILAKLFILLILSSSKYTFCSRSVAITRDIAITRKKLHSDGAAYRRFLFISRCLFI